MPPAARMLLWKLDAIAGFDTAWVSLDGDRLTAEGQQSALAPMAYWARYRLETASDFVTARMAVESRWEGGSASLDLRRAHTGAWTVHAEPRADLDGALDVDLAACPLTNTMPIRRHELHRHEGEHELLMAFIEVPSLRVVAMRQHYGHLRRLEDGGGIVRYRSGSFQSDLTIDVDGFVVEYPQLGGRVTAVESPR